MESLITNLSEAIAWCVEHNANVYWQELNPSVTRRKNAVLINYRNPLTNERDAVGGRSFEAAVCKAAFRATLVMNKPEAEDDRQDTLS